MSGYLKYLFRLCGTEINLTYAHHLDTNGHSSECMLRKSWNKWLDNPKSCLLDFVVHFKLRREFGQVTNTLDMPKDWKIHKVVLCKFVEKICVRFQSCTSIFTLGSS